MLRHESCIACTSKSLEKVVGYEEHNLWKCQSCKLVFSVKIPSIDELERHYQTYAYGEAQYFSPITKKRYSELLKAFFPYKKTNRILDIGCGSGFFLETARDSGWEVYGTEFSETAIQVCKKKGIQMVEGALQLDQFPENYFDVITSFEVIEHINDPRRELENISRFLKSGGLLYCTTPNFNSVSRMLVGPSWNVINYPEHLTYYSALSLHNLFSSFNLKRLKLATTGVSITGLRLSKKKKDKIMGMQSSDEKFRQQAEKRWFIQIVKNSLNYLLSKIKRGDSLKAWYIKN